MSKSVIQQKTYWDTGVYVSKTLKKNTKIKL